MRLIAVAATPALLTCATPVMSSGWFNYQKNTKDLLDWHESNHKLSLRSGKSDGIQVTQTTPTSLWGLREGDTILAIDNQRVDHVDDMLKLLLAKKPAIVTMHVRNQQSERSIQVASTDYMQIVLPSSPQ